MGYLGFLGPGSTQIAPGGPTYMDLFFDGLRRPPWEQKRATYRDLLSPRGVAGTRDERGPGNSGQVQDLQGHHQDDQEQILDHF